RIVEIELHRRARLPRAAGVDGDQPADGAAGVARPPDLHVQVVRFAEERGLDVVDDAAEGGEAGYGSGAGVAPAVRRPDEAGVGGDGPLDRLLHVAEPVGEMGRAPALD